MKKVDFIPNDELSKFDFLFEQRVKSIRTFTGQVMVIEDDAAVYLFSQDYEGCLIDDPTTWLYAQPETSMQSLVPPRIGQNVLWNFTDGNNGDARYIGLDRDYEKSPNGALGQEIIHENLSGQTIRFDYLEQKYIIENLTSKIEISATGVTIIAPNANITIPLTSLTGNLNIVGTLIVNGTDILTTLLTVQAALVALLTQYLAHTHAVTTAPGVTGPPM